MGESLIPVIALVVALALAVALNLRVPDADLNRKPVVKAAGAPEQPHIEPSHAFELVPPPFEPMRDNPPWLHYWDQAAEDLWWVPSTTPLGSPIPLLASADQQPTPAA